MVARGSEFRDFGEYEEARLAGKGTLEQLLLMDSELANYAHLDRYIGPLHPADLPFMREAYDEQFAEFIDERLGTAGQENVDGEGFAEFREGIAELNRTLNGWQSGEIDVLAESAERLLTKRLRRNGLDPSQMDLDCFVESDNGVGVTV